MGQNIEKMQLDENTAYEGQAFENIPHGKGILTLQNRNKKNRKGTDQKNNKNQQNKQNQQSMIVEGMFEKGELIHGSFQFQGLKYNGKIKRGQVCGSGRLQHKQSGTVWEGEFEGGQLVKGKVSKIGQYECKGCFAEVNSTRKQRRPSKQKFQSQETKIFQFFGSQNEFFWLKNKQKLEGKFESGELQGAGTYTFFNGDIYQGQFKNGYFEGKGQYSSKSKHLKSITGSFMKSLPENLPGQFESNNKILFNNQDQYQGQLKGGQMHGKNGTYTFSGGAVYRGSLHFGKFSGDCQISYPPTSQLEKYKGQISDGMLHGLGVLEYKNGVILKGYFLNNMKNGPCIIIYGERMWKCLYIMDQLEGDLTQVIKSK